jgi:hypothetical protein
MRIIILSIRLILINNRYSNFLSVVFYSSAIPGRSWCVVIKELLQRSEGWYWKNKDHEMQQNTWRFSKK